MQWLSQFLSGKNRPIAPPTPKLPCPALPVCIIGDLHGRADLLDHLLSMITDQPASATARLIFVGDLIDRGPDSAAVLSRVRQLAEDAPDRVICLMGNHERMMLDFLDTPANGTRWLRYGAVETLASLGVQGRAVGDTPEDRLQALATRLRQALPEGMETWLRTRPLWWQEGKLAVVHAGANPNLPIVAQTAQTFLWGHRDFLQIPRQDGLWVAHGHSVVETANAKAGRIAVDTGAWESGRLTAAWLDADGLRFIEAG
ncbi:MAG: metallophosphoesterase [Microgenomates group bacterium]